MYEGRWLAHLPPRFAVARAEGRPAVDMLTQSGLSPPVLFKPEGAGASQPASGSQ